MNDQISKGAWEVFFDALVGGSVGHAIEQQEARGQAELVHSETLPRKCNGCTREQLEGMGIKFGEDVDDLFVRVMLPLGWKKEATDHSMWSKLLDDKGRERASMFYKAAFYDRDAFINISRRFSHTCLPVGGWENRGEGQPEEGLVMDCGVVVWRTDPMPTSKDEPDWKVDEKLRPQCIAWLDEHYPDWKNPLAYWD